MKKIIIFLFVVFSFYANANVLLPKLFADGMVLQRNKPIPVWGWADANEKIEVHFNKQTKTIQADEHGKWIVNLSAEKAGGPFELIIIGKNKIIIKDVLVGEVWLCSGQSNMEFTVKQAQNFPEERKDANYPQIRHFLVEKDISATPKQDLKTAKWSNCSSETVGDFTAVGYFFAKKLYKELNIPIGLIHSSWGGTMVETWTSHEAFENSIEFKEMISKLPKLDLDSISKKYRKELTDKIEKIQGGKISLQNEDLYKTNIFEDASWDEIKVPSLWENQQLGNIDGIVWVRKTIEISVEDSKNEAVLHLAKIDDEDITYVNGVEVGRNTIWEKDRVYTIPAGVLKVGKNIIAIRIVDNSGGGGIYGDTAEMKLVVNQKNIPLDGKWKYRVVEVKSEVGPNSYPSLLYNAMINPLIPYAFQGVLWYQGEANVTRANQYKIAFPLLITDWRAKWKQGDFPFYFVQLSTFNEFNGNSNSGSKWAELRDAQTKTLTLPNTGMAVTTDIGNAKDIHPTNKQDVGVRLAAIALNKVYKKKVVFEGPTFKSKETKGNQIVLTFDNVCAGLNSGKKSTTLNGFEIAGTNKVFYPAKAIIKDNKVIVSNDKVPNPVAVRYAWSDDASAANLYNKEGFPASQFRTDDWLLSTESVKYQF